MTAWFLGKEDRVKAIVRVKENMTGIKNDNFQWKQCREALFDSNAWLLVLIQLCANIPNGGIHSVSIALRQSLYNEGANKECDIVQLYYHRGHGLRYSYYIAPDERYIRSPDRMGPTL